MNPDYFALAAIAICTVTVSGILHSVDLEPAPCSTCREGTVSHGARCPNCLAWRPYRSSLKRSGLGVSIIALVFIAFYWAPFNITGGLARSIHDQVELWHCVDTLRVVRPEISPIVKCEVGIFGLEAHYPDGYTDSIVRLFRSRSAGCLQPREPAVRASPKPPSGRTIVARRGGLRR